MRDFETGQNDRRLSNVAEMGVVEAVDYANPPRARVRVGELLTGWLRMGAMRAGGDKDWAVYEIGEEVLVVSASGDLRHGVIVCAINNGTNPGNAASADIRRTDFGNGSFVEHNRASGK
ncbi:MAG: phage baseplate assembly protein V, partial [Paracoccus sp. (in: a-proteobacteria)]